MDPTIVGLDGLPSGFTYQSLNGRLSGSGTSGPSVASEERIAGAVEIPPPCLLCAYYCEAAALEPPLSL